MHTIKQYLFWGLLAFINVKIGLITSICKAVKNGVIYIDIFVFRVGMMCVFFLWLIIAGWRREINFVVSKNVVKHGRCKKMFGWNFMLKTGGRRRVVNFLGVEFYVKKRQTKAGGKFFGSGIFCSKPPAEGRRQIFGHIFSSFWTHLFNSSYPLFLE